MYVYTDASGALFITDQPYLANDGFVKGRSWKSSPMHEYQDMIKSISARYRVNPKLVTAVIATESNFDELAISRTGAMGLMQLMPDTATHLGVRNPFDPKENIEGGVKYLRYLIERFNGDLELAVAAYNCGPTTVSKYGKIPPYGETRRYVKKVFDLYNGKKSMYISPSQSRTVRKIVRADGSTIYTNISPEAFLKP
jgi:soluble lytic murein transglycosylase-like protein